MYGNGLPSRSGLWSYNQRQRIDAGDHLGDQRTDLRLVGRGGLANGEEVGRHQ